MWIEPIRSEHVDNDYESDEGELRRRFIKKKKREKYLAREDYSGISEPGLDPGTCGLWAHHASAAPL